MAKVSEFMTTEVLTLAPDMSIDKAVSALIDRGVHGAPVVQNGALVGVLTDGDLVIGESRIHVPSMLMIFGEFAMWPPSVRKFERESEKSIATTVGEAMTREVHTVSP
ncbi:MAG: CBS domain-containing protein, partial [Acidimicrobiales bacterium]